MNRLRRLPFLLLLLTLASLCACSSVEKRIRANQLAFASAVPRQQELMQQGLIELGFTDTMVLIALDRPDVVTPLPDDRSERWVYRNFAPPLGTSTMGGTKLSDKSFRGISPAKNYDTRADPSGPVDATQHNLVLLFTDHRLVSMQLMTN